MSDIVTKEPSNVFDLVKMQEPFFKQVLDSDVVTWQKECQFAIQHLQKNDFAAKTAWSNRASLQNAIINVASIGISLNPANRHAYLVPRDGAICLDVSYMGMLHLAMQSGAIEWGQAKVVYSNDTYESNGLNKEPTHKYNAFGERGEPVGVYCTVKLPSGDYLTEEMSKDQVYDIRARSKAFTSGKSCPWTTDELEMWRKTVVKRASKYWPSCERLHKAIEVVNEHEGFDEPDSYTEEEKQIFDSLIEHEDAFGMCAFMSLRDHDQQTSLFNSFPKNHISSNKAKVRKLQSDGFQSWESFMQDLRSMIAEEDGFGIKGHIEGFEDYEKRHLKNMLGDDYDNFLKLIKEE